MTFIHRIWLHKARNEVTNAKDDFYHVQRDYCTPDIEDRIVGIALFIIDLETAIGKKKK